MKILIVGTCFSSMALQQIRAMELAGAEIVQMSKDEFDSKSVSDGRDLQELLIDEMNDMEFEILSELVMLEAREAGRMRLNELEPALKKLEMLSRPSYDNIPKRQNYKGEKIPISTRNQRRLQNRKK